MSMERSRRERFTNMAPSAVEFKVAVLLGGVLLLLVTPLVVQGVVGWAASGEFAWPNRHLPEAYGGLLHGHFGAGLHRSVTGGLPPDAVLWLLTVAGEVLVLGAAAVVGRWMRDLTGASARHGLATAGQAAEALGVLRLRKSAEVVRPDLHPRSRRRNSVGSK